MNKFEVKDHEPSFLPEGEWKLVWSDERKKNADRVPCDIEGEFVDDAFIVDFVRVFDRIG